jgi:hypothetical protein
VDGQLSHRERHLKLFQSILEKRARTNRLLPNQPLHPKGQCSLLMCTTGIHVCPYSGSPKPSKSALKKAAKTARTEKRQQEKAVRNRTPDNSQSKALVPTVEPTAAHVDGMVHKYEDVISSTEPSYPTSMDTSGRTSPDALDDTNTGDPLNEELQLALQNKLDQQQAAERAKKKQNFFTRSLWGFIMIGGFIGSFSTPFMFFSG